MPKLREEYFVGNRAHSDLPATDLPMRKFIAYDLVCQGRGGMNFRRCQKIREIVGNVVTGNF
jgi:hypothetical protein